MRNHERYILSVIKSFDSGNNIQAAITGSFRRHEPSSGDIDVLISGCSDEVFTQMISKLKDDGYITDVFAEGKKKVLAVGRLMKKEERVTELYRRVDFMLTHDHEFPFALLYFTGSGQFNISMRQWALAKGYSLSEYGLKHVGTNEFIDHVFKSEEDIFKFLGIRYVEPVERKNKL